MKTDLFGLGGGRTGGYRSLDFEPDLMAQIGRTRPSFRLRPSGRRYWAAAMVPVALVMGAVLWVRDSGDERAVAQMAATAFEWLRNGRIAPMSTESAGSTPAGLALLVGNSTVSAESQETVSPEDSTLRQAILARIRAQVESSGGRWTDARLLAFGGVRARVRAPGAEEAVAITGNLYLDAGGRLYAIELSAERVHDRYVPTDFWQCVPLEGAAGETEKLEGHARQCYEAFLGEPPLPAPSGQEIQFLDPEPVFVRL